MLKFGSICVATVVLYAVGGCRSATAAPAGRSTAAALVGPSQALLAPASRATSLIQFGLTRVLGLTIRSVKHARRLAAVVEGTIESRASRRACRKRQMPNFCRLKSCELPSFTPATNRRWRANWSSGRKTIRGLTYCCAKLVPQLWFPDGHSRTMTKRATNYRAAEFVVRELFAFQAR
jgi:hypothetical protein